MRIKSIRHMSYIKVSWPDSQALMSLTDEDMEDYGIELGEDCSYFVPEEDYEEVFSVAEDRRLNESWDDRRKEEPWQYN
jgi:hypothetical protein